MAALGTVWYGIHDGQCSGTPYRSGRRRGRYRRRRCRADRVVLHQADQPVDRRGLLRPDTACGHTRSVPDMPGLSPLDPAGDLGGTDCGGRVGDQSTVCGKQFRNRRADSARNASKPSLRAGRSRQFDCDGAREGSRRPDGSGTDHITRRLSQRSRTRATAAASLLGTGRGRRGWRPVFTAVIR